MNENIDIHNTDRASKRKQKKPLSLLTSRFSVTIISYTVTLSLLLHLEILSPWPMLTSLTMSFNKVGGTNYGFLLSIPTFTFTLLLLLLPQAGAAEFILSPTPISSPPVDFTLTATTTTYLTLATVISWDISVARLLLHPPQSPSSAIILLTPGFLPETFSSSNPSLCLYLCLLSLTLDSLTI